MDQKTGSPIESAAHNLNVSVQIETWGGARTYGNIMKTVLDKDALPFSFRPCVCNFLERSSHGVRGAQLEVPKNFMQLRVRHKTLWAWVGGSSSTATAKVGRLLSVLWLNQNAGVENPTETVGTAMSIAIMRTASQWFEYDFQNLLVNISLEVSKFFGLSGWPAWRIRGINNLHNTLSSGCKFSMWNSPSAYIQHLRFRKHS